MMSSACSLRVIRFFLALFSRTFFTFSSMERVIVGIENLQRVSHTSRNLQLPFIYHLNFRRLSILTIKKRYRRIAIARPISHMTIFKNVTWLKLAHGENRDMIAITAKKERNISNTFNTSSRVSLPL